jgi:acyl-CoA synthetase (AMP-forming)/AMP-acid ligase II
VEPAEWDIEPINPDDVAYLQYTSGSTRDPAGVQITHRNLATNTSQLWTRLAVGQRRSIVVVSWLPLFHDMGLISTLAAPLLQGIHVEFTDPMAFVRQPSRWLALISGHGGKEPNGVADHETVDAKNDAEIHTETDTKIATEIDTEIDTEIFVAAPNFAYEYCLARVRDRSAFDLRRLRWCLNGAEPVRQSTLERFAETFAEVGLRPGAQSPCYGLAEATVFVSAASDEVPPTITIVDQQSLTAGVVVPRAPGSGRTTTLVSCGKTAGQYVAIVDPETCRELSDGRIGEIWVHGPNVSPGYWRKPERTREIFGGRLVDPAPGLPEGPWLRTGDLGAVHEGELYVTGRIKDLIIVNGRNHYPQDIETTVQEAHPAVRADHVAAFTIPGDRDERVVVVAERSREASSPGLDASDVRRIVVSAVGTHHELPVHDFVLVRTGGVPRTSSGKVSRTACKQRYLAGLLPQISA